MDNTRVYKMSFASVYPHYITKAEKKWPNKGRARYRHSLADGIQSTTTTTTYRQED